MWASTPSKRAERGAAALLLALALVIVPAGAAAADAPSDAPAAPALPRSVQDVAPGLTVRGGGLMTFYGISVYDGWYWSATRGWPADGPQALDLIYHRDLEGSKIAQRSVEEIETLGYGTPEQRTRWGELMARIFPNVSKGDRLTGVSVKGGAVRYFHNGKPIGTIDEPGFARAFFGIWLDPKSSRADFREKLLGAP